MQANCADACTDPLSSPGAALIIRPAMTRPTLLGFVDDEMLRAPLTFDQVIDAVYELWRKVLAVHERHGSDAARMLQLHREEIVRETMRSLRGLVQAGISAAAAPAAPAVPTRSGRLELSLIDDNDVAVDIEIARCVEAIKSHAEFELRELQSLTSALVGDVNVARDTNPFRPETFVRAFWDGVQTLPAPRGLQAAFLRDAALPLAQALRQGYAAACARLEEQGVEPASYRTIVVHRTVGAGHTGPTTRSHDLNMLRDSLTMPLDAPSAARQFVTTTTASLPHRGAVDQRLIELLSRLFDAIQSDRGLPPEAQALLLRLQPTVLRVAMRDASLLDSYDHVVWRFMDHLVFMIERGSGAELGRAMGFARNLVDHLVTDATDDGSRFEWALGRLEAFERHALAQTIAASGPLIARLQAAEAAQAPPVSSVGEPLDLAALDTVPAALLDAQPPQPAAATPPVASMKPGDWLEVYLQGDWRVLQLLWCDSDAELWLLRQPAADRYWALRPRAVERLLAEHLAWVLLARSLVRDAAECVLLSLEPRAT
jgi:hypothetical protein